MDDEYEKRLTNEISISRECFNYTEVHAYMKALKIYRELKSKGEI